MQPNGTQQSGTMRVLLMSESLREELLLAGNCERLTGFISGNPAQTGNNMNPATTLSRTAWRHVEHML